MMLPPLEGWDNFYVIIGSSAAALTGLMFVVIALIPEKQIPRDTTALEAFASPTIVHFCGVLLIAAFITMPRHSMMSLLVSRLISGAAGVVYATIVILRSVRQRSYQPELEDWIFHAILPAIAYITLFNASFFIVGSSENALVGVAASALLLLFIGIHNAWDAAVWMTTAGRRIQDEERAIRDVMEQWLRATKAADLNAVLNLMTDDVVFLRAGQPTMNKAAFADSFKSFAGKVTFDAQQDVEEIRALGDLGYAWTHMTLTMNGKTRSGDILSVFRKVNEKWLLSRDANFVT